MKGIVIFLSVFFLLTSSSVFSQKKNSPKSIISSSAAITKYHNQKELQGMQKGELLELYIERIKVLIKTLPYIALTTKSGVTVDDLGIPNNSKNTKALILQEEAASNFLDVTVGFQKDMVPYADKNNLITSILFCENTLKELHLFDEQ